VLRILRDNEESDRVVLILQGHIVLEWIDLLESECREFSRRGLPLALDLSGVDFIGRSGLEALARLSRAGVGIIGCSPLVADTLEQEGIEVSRRSGDTNGGRVPGDR
jgi:anti-anti-sigma regulatory factor